MELLECVHEYLADCYALAKRTRGLYEWHLYRFSRFAEDNGLVHMSEVTARQIRQYLGGLRRKNGGEYSPAFLNQVYRVLNTWLKWCVQEGILEENPMDRVRCPRVPKRKSPCLSLDEIKQVLEVIRTRTQDPERNLAMTWLMLDSGLRRGEVVGLDIGDVDLERGIARVLGKDREERFVPIGEQSIKAVRTWLEVRPGANCALFVNRRGERLTGNAVQLMLQRVKKKAEGVDELYAHMLRHTFANWWIRNGGSLRKLQEVLGHADVGTTASIYVSPELDDLQAEHATVSLGNRLNDV